MGFRTGAFATVWEVNPVSEKVTKLKISISRKKHDSDEYETDFSGFVSALGTAAAAKAAKLKGKARIKLGDVEVTRVYDKAKQKEFVNFNLYSFDLADAAGGADDTKQKKGVDDGEPDSRLPY